MNDTMTKKKAIDGITDDMFLLEDDIGGAEPSVGEEELSDDLWNTLEITPASDEVVLVSLDEEVEIEVDTDAYLSKPAPERTSIFDLITDIDDKVEYLTWLIYGKNGTGKTTMLSTLDGMLVLAAEDGTLSIREKAKGRAKKVKVDDWSIVEEVYWSLKNGKHVLNADGKVEGIMIPVRDGLFLVKAIAFDTLTKLSDICMRNVVDSPADILNPTLRHRGQMADRMKYWLEAFDELPIQKVWLVQEGANSEDVDSDEFSIAPALQKSLKTYVLSQADVIGRTFIKRQDDGKPQFRVSFLPNASFVTKDRTNRLGGVMANPSLAKLFDRAFSDPEPPKTTGK